MLRREIIEDLFSFPTSHLSKHEYVKFSQTKLFLSRRKRYPRSLLKIQQIYPGSRPSSPSSFRGSRNRETRRRLGRQRKMINLKAEVKKRASRMIHGAVVARIMANIAAKEQRPSLLAARRAGERAEVRCPRVTRSRVGLWRSKPRIGFLVSRKWLPWMVLVTGISHLWDALRASFPEDSGPEWSPEYTPLVSLTVSTPTFPTRPPFHSYW